MNSPVEIERAAEPGLEPGEEALDSELCSPAERGLGGKWSLPLAKLTHVGLSQSQWRMSRAGDKLPWGRHCGDCPSLKEAVATG